MLTFQLAQTMHNAELKFAVPANYRHVLEKCEAKFLDKEMIQDNYLDTRGLDLLQAGTYLRQRNSEMELKVPMNWQGDYKNYNGITEFFVFREEEIENILKDRFKTSLQDTKNLCSATFEREYWSHKEHCVIIDTIFGVGNEEMSRFGEIKFPEAVVRSGIDGRQKAMEILNELGFDRSIQGKLMTILKTQNSFAYLKLKTMTGL